MIVQLGTSLNDQLLSGPDLTNSLVGVLLRFRQEPIAMMSDVEQMFHQVYVDPKGRDVFRFLWWPNGDIEAKAEEFQMQVHLFGATSSPSCANFSLRRTAEDNRKDFDLEVTETVNRNFYVDDCLKSTATIERALFLVKELPRLLERGGFNLTKWFSNRPEVMTTIPVEKRAPCVVDLDLENSRTDRALEVQWNIQNDTFGFKVNNSVSVHSRRNILSLVSSTYDPLGIAAPLLLPAKKILQELCRNLIGWDEIIPPEISMVWEKWMSNLPSFENLVVPRCLKPEILGKISSTQLHHFADASEIGYGAVSYLRLVDESGVKHCVLLMGKSRVAPLKLLTIPRLELSAATLAVKLHKFISNELELPIHNTKFWTDSTIVIQYIRNESRRFQTFTANRLAIIHDISSHNQWNYVPSENNPADSASRGLDINDSRKLEQWLNGPSFLLKDESYWPEQPKDLIKLDDDDEELKKKPAHIHSVTHEDSIYSLLNEFSSWQRLQISIAWFLHFKSFLLARHLKANVPPSGPLKVRELHQSTNEIVRLVQERSFPKELEVIKTGKVGSLSKVLRGTGYLSPLRKLNPIIVDGILRVGGRLQSASIGYSASHPMILPRKHTVTKLISRSLPSNGGTCW